MRPVRTVTAVALMAASLALSACQTRVAPSGTPAVGATPTAAASTSVPVTLPATTPEATVAGSTGLPIHLVKNCSAFNGEIPSYCTISVSDYAPIPVGAKVGYLGPLLDNQNFLSSNVLIDDARGNTATGYCIFDARPTEERGFCTFWAGTGTLDGFTAIFKVSIDALGEWHLDGESYAKPPTPAPS